LLLGRKLVLEVLDVVVCVVLHSGLRRLISVLAQEAIDWYVNHDRRDVRNFKGRMKFILEAVADRVANEIKPSDIDIRISSHKWSAATKNRYKNVFGKTFKIALADGKVTSNPARMVEQRAENNARIRFLSAVEEERLRAAIKKRFPKHMPEFDVALNTGMRKSEQFSLEWSQVSLTRKRICLLDAIRAKSEQSGTKSGTSTYLGVIH
jgi:site-specific recombinase XerD